MALQKRFLTCGALVAAFLSANAEGGDRPQNDGQSEYGLHISSATHSVSASVPWGELRPYTVSQSPPLQQVEGMLECVPFVNQIPQQTSAQGNLARGEVRCFALAEPLESNARTYVLFIYGTVDPNGSAWSVTTSGVGDSAGPTMRVSSEIIEGSGAYFPSLYVRPRSASDIQNKVESPKAGNDEAPEIQEKSNLSPIAAITVGLQMAGIIGPPLIEWAQDVLFGDHFEIDVPTLSNDRIVWRAGLNPGFAEKVDTRAWSWGYACVVSAPLNVSPRVRVTLEGNFYNTGGFGFSTDRVASSVDIRLTRPEPEILEFDAPSSIEEGQFATIRLRARNLGGAANDGQISISFPGGTNEVVVQAESTGDNYNNAFYPGQEIWHRNLFQFPAQYTLAELGEVNWGQGQEETLSVDALAAPGADKMIVLYRVNLDRVNEPYSNEYEDQQGWPVFRKEIRITSPTPTFTPTHTPTPSPTSTFTPTPTFTVTPTYTFTPTNTPMDTPDLPTPTQGTVALLRTFDFDGTALEGTSFVDVPGGLDRSAGFPAGQLRLGNIPSDNAYPGATDGHGLAITVGPGQVHAALGPPISVGRLPVAVRAAFRSTGGSAWIFIGGWPAENNNADGSMGISNTASSHAFLNTWKRLYVTIAPPAPNTQVYPFIQIANLGGGETTTVYVDRLEFYVMPPGTYVNSEFFGSDGTGP